MKKHPYYFVAMAIILLLVVIVFLTWPKGQAPTQKIESPQASTVESPTVPDEVFYLTVPKMERVNNLPVYSGEEEESLRESLYRVPSTGLPWQTGENTFVAGHRLGYPRTDSLLVFYDLTKLENGDKIYADDSLGNRYTYEVYETITVKPDAIEVLEPVGEDIISLQTCTLPDYSERIIVRAREI